MANESVTLRQIARKVGVSVGTVSRALAGENGVSDRRARTIQDLAKQMGYRPQPLRRQRAGAIAVLVGTSESGHPDEDWSQRLIVLATRASAELSWHVHLEFVSRNDNRRAVAVPTVVRENRVDGVLLAGDPHSSIIEYLHRHEIPMAMVGGSAAKTGCVCVNPGREQAVRTAIHRLFELGHRRFGVVLSDRRYPSTEAFYRNCRQSLADHGIELSPRQVLENLQPNLGGGVIAARRYLAAGEPLPTAMLFTNDWMALGAMMTLLEAGCRVPRDVSIIGQDNLPWCNQMEPALCSMDNREERMVREALVWLRRRIEGGPQEPHDVTVHSELVWRGSCGPAPQGSPNGAGVASPAPAESRQADLSRFSLASPSGANEPGDSSENSSHISSRKGEAKGEANEER